MINAFVHTAKNIHRGVIDGLLTNLRSSEHCQSLDLTNDNVQSFNRQVMCIYVYQPACMVLSASVMNIYMLLRC